MVDRSSSAPQSRNRCSRVIDHLGCAAYLPNDVLSVALHVLIITFSWLPENACFRTVVRPGTQLDARPGFGFPGTPGLRGQSK